MYIYIIIRYDVELYKLNATRELLLNNNDAEIINTNSYTTYLYYNVIQKSDNNDN